jgi:hypothetical protein
MVKQTHFQFVYLFCPNSQSSALHVLLGRTRKGKSEGNIKGKLESFSFFQLVKTNAFLRQSVAC